MKTYVFGDIHGAYKALIQLMAKINFKEEDHLIFLGDYVDGWSENAEVVDFLIDLNTKQKCTFIKGNHDQYCIDWLKHGKMVGNWLQHGGDQTMLSYHKVNNETKQKHLSFLESCKMYYVDEKNNLFVHAGFTSEFGVKHEEEEENLFWDRTLLKKALSIEDLVSKGEKQSSKRLNCYNEIYIGHTSTTKFGKTTPINAANLWMIDTGAAYTGKFSCICAETKEIFQSEIVANLYPNEIGRN